MSRLRAVTPAHVAIRHIDEEAVLLNLDTGVYHGLDPIGRDFLTALESHDTVAAAADALARRYQVSPARIHEDLERFCERMVERGLLDFSDRT